MSHVKFVTSLFYDINKGNFLWKLLLIIVSFWEWRHVPESNGRSLYDCHLGVILENHKKIQTIQKFKSICLHLIHRDNILQKVKYGLSNVMHHTSHIAKNNWKFYKIFRIIVVVHFSNLIKLLLNKLIKIYGNYCIGNTNAWVMSKITRTKKKLMKNYIFQKVKFSLRILKNTKKKT